ncbi:MAG: flavodoxin family protein [Peptostreptococcaceae bacterium]|nr:flavodoxin family protein [Peptostreptococcaceae bacterium]
MKTLIFNGSPRTNGDTAILINEVIRNLQGDHKIIHAYDCNIKACIDCRYCWKNEGCSQIDGMQEVYNYIQEYGSSTD